MPMCLSCNKTCADFKELAIHIQSSKKGHRKGKRWAAKYILRVRSLDKKKLNGRMSLTKEQKDNRKDTIRELSGKNEKVVTYCPRCKSPKGGLMPIEFTQSKVAWRIKDKLVVVCEICGG